MNQKIAEFILTVQKEICKVKRNAENKHHGSSYADLEGVLDLLNPYFSQYNVMVDQNPIYLEHGWVLRTTFVIGDELKDWDIPLLGTDSKTPMQSLGSAITFARRYQLKGIFKLVVTPSGAPSKVARKSEIDKMLRAFAALNVGKSDVESMVQTDSDKFTVSDMESLKKAYIAIKSGSKRKEDYMAGDVEWQD
jgi:hypothetical protein